MSKCVLCGVKEKDGIGGVKFIMFPIKKYGDKNKMSLCPYWEYQGQHTCICSYCLEIIKDAFHVRVNYKLESKGV